MYRVDVDPHALRQLRRIPERDRLRVLTAIEGLANNARPPGAVKVSGRVHRLRIGPFRVLYAIYDREQRVLIGRVVRREKDTYRDIDGIF